jgi:hypothetical protein
MMSQRSKQEVLEALRPRYLQASRRQKQQMLDEFTATTGYHRKYAIRALRHPPGRSPHRRRPGRPATYRGQVVEILEQVWEIYGRICSKRLQPYLAEGLRVLERCGEIQMAPPLRSLLLGMSASTIDRCLKAVRPKGPRGLSTTKPGALLKGAIPVRTFTPWDEERPGFLEVDLVAHCGESTAGQFLNTLTCTDVCTGWTDVTALRTRSQQAVCNALQGMGQRLPFPLLGLDSDNGGEFINDLLYRYCQDEHITFTRSRPYQKNDQAHVEQKNWSVVRHTVGYDRLESEAEWQLLENLYADLRLYINFFQPVLKLISKQKLGNRVVRRYDQARTPYRRVMERPQTSLACKADLAGQYVQLNPLQLRRRIDEQVARLWKIAR